MRFLHEKFRPTTSAIHRIVAHTYDRNPLYRKKMQARGVAPHQIESAHDLEQLPFTTREDLGTDPWALLCVPRSTLVQAHMSTGTTGRNPLYVAYDWEDLYTRGLMPLNSDPAVPRLLRIEPGEIVFNALPYEVSVTGLAIHRSIQDGIGACVVPLGKGGFYSEPWKALKMMREIQGDHLFTTPSYALYLAELAGAPREWLKEVFGLRSIWLVGELCSDALRRRIERMWGAPAFLYYGTMESGPVGVECAEQDGYHLATNFTAVEIVATPVPVTDAHGMALGEVVVTTLWRHATPLIRYRTGDLGRWDERPGATGEIGRRLRVHGRLEDVVRAGGKTLHVLDIEQGLLTLPEVSAWFQLRVDGDLLKVLLPAEDGVDAEVAARRARQWVSDSLGVECDVEHAPPRTYAGGKFMRVVRTSQGEAK
ncbi:phenylacetate--CoA ligase family protein [Variovorax paradoxus]|uniref:phenylacetate--CoA ligase family protein n=1 Tax=Variovorax paradoxus TaxID=34073 RepID=UPI001ABCD483